MYLVAFNHLCEKKLHIQDSLMLQFPCISASISQSISVDPGGSVVLVIYNAGQKVRRFICQILSSL